MSSTQSAIPPVGTTPAPDAPRPTGDATTSAQATGVPATMTTAQPAMIPQSVVPGGATVDVASILAKVQQLEQANSALQNNFAAANAQLSKFKEGKRTEMETLLNSTIAKWLQQLETKDQASKAQLESGLKALAADGNESGVWEVVACASSNWQSNVNEIEQLRTKLNSYEEREKELAASGVFSREVDRIESTSDSNKRKASEISEFEQKNDIWSEFETMIMGRGGNTGENWMGPSGDSINALNRLG